jgi:hypothetical protein
MLWFPPHVLPLGHLAGFEDDTRKGFEARRYKWPLRQDALKAPSCHDNFLRHKAIVSKSWIRIFHIYPIKHNAAQWPRQQIVSHIDIMRGALVSQGHQSTAPLASLHLRAYIKPESKAAHGLMQTQLQTLGTFDVSLDPYTAMTDSEISA